MGRPSYIVRNIFFLKITSQFCGLCLTVQLYNVSAVVGVDAELEESSVDDVIQCEDRIVFQSWALLPAGSEDEVQHGVNQLDEILGRLGLQTRLVVVERANSVVLIFICLTLSAVMCLRDQWRNGQLRDVVESLFTFLSGAAQTVRVKRLTWLLTDYERCLEFFSSLQGKLEWFNCLLPLQ